MHIVRYAVVVGLLGLLAGCATPAMEPEVERRFVVAAIPDTQNYLDYTHQTDAGFALDAADQFHAQMQYIADRSVTRGGDIVFAIHLGDVWQHQTIEMDEEHHHAGFKAIDNYWFGRHLQTNPEKVFGVEIPAAREGFRYLARSGLPFGVVPGNHDYDAMWSSSEWPPADHRTVEPHQIRITPEFLGMLHAGGLDNFRSVFGKDSEFFKDKDWYIGSYDGGASSAQTFSAAGYTFLHLALDMSPKDDVLAWAGDVIAQNPGLPTIVTTHDFLNAHNERKATPIVDFHAVDPRHNNAEMLWQKFLSQHPQIFMVLSGHQHGQGFRADDNRIGGKVYQIMADYQDRAQSSLDAGQPVHPGTGRAPGTGDGWFRLMQFDFTGEMPLMKVSTYSTHYRIPSTELDSYATWYRAYEQPEMTDTEFVEADNFTVELVDFYERFGRQ
jgi:hypothetical protein